MKNNGQFKQFIFGKTVLCEKPLSPEEMSALIAKAKDFYRNSKTPSQKEVLDVFARVSEAWKGPLYHFRKEAFDSIREAAGFSPEFVTTVIKELPRLFSPATLIKKMTGEFGDSGIQDKSVFQESTNASLISQPSGLVLHVASGNVFLACLESLIDGIITKNINFVKMSTADRRFPVLFAESIKEFDKDGIITERLAILWWEAGDQAIESLFKKSMNRIVFWGGYDALLSWKKNIGEESTLIQHGPKVSFGIVSKAGLESADVGELTGRIALDISVWEQRACNCPQILFLESNISSDDIDRFLGLLSGGLKRMAVKIPSARRTNDEYVEILRARELGTAKNLATGKETRVMGPGTLEWTILYDPSEKEGDRFELSPLGRTILVRRYKSLEDLSSLIRDKSFYLQTAGYCLGEREADEYSLGLSKAGVTRVCPFGVMAMPIPGTPHDGSYALRDLTRFTVVEK